MPGRGAREAFVVADYNADFHPDHVAGLIASQLSGATAPCDVETNGAATAAALIAELL